MRKFVQLGFGKEAGWSWHEKVLKVAQGARYVIPVGSWASDISQIVDEPHRYGVNEGVFSVCPWDILIHQGGETYHDTIRDKTWRPEPEQIAKEAQQLEHEMVRRGMSEWYIEVGPEINIDPVYKKNHGLIADTVEAVYEAVKTFPIVGPAVSNLAKDGRRHLERFTPRLPGNTLMCFHPYRTTSPADKFEGFGTPQELCEYVLAVAGGRGMAITEAGWHDAKQIYHTGCLGLKKRESHFTRQQVAEFCRWDFEFWCAMGVEFYTWYQNRDGAPNDPNTESHFGLYTAAGEMKPVGQEYGELSC